MPHRTDELLTLPGCAATALIPIRGVVDDAKENGRNGNPNLWYLKKNSVKLGKFSSETFFFLFPSQAMVLASYCALLCANLQDSWCELSYERGKKRAPLQRKVSTFLSPRFSKGKGVYLRFTKVRPFWFRSVAAALTLFALTLTLSLPISLPLYRATSKRTQKSIATLCKPGTRDGSSGGSRCSKLLCNAHSLCWLALP